MKIEEIWKNISGFNNYYWVSSLGRVKKIYPNGKILYLSLTKNKKRHNYVYVNLENLSERKNWSLHRLVSKYFIPNPHNKPCINHKDCNVLNNRVDNLEWCTYQENSDHSKKLGRMKSSRGELSGNHKLIEKTVLSIIELINSRNKSYREIAKKFNTNYSNIAHISRGSRWGYLNHLITR